MRILFTPLFTWHAQQLSPCLKGGLLPPCATRRHLYICTILMPSPVKKTKSWYLGKWHFNRFVPLLLTRDCRFVVLAVVFIVISGSQSCPPFSYGHRTLKARLPVRSALVKQCIARLVLWWVTTWESLVL
jgi:hypothetical protein